MDGDADGFEGGAEAIGRGGCGDDRHGAFAVAAVECLEEVGLFGFGGEAGAGAATLDVDNDEREFDGACEAHEFGFEAHAGAAGAGDADVAGVACAECDADSGDFILGLDGADAEVFVAGEHFQDGGGGGDGVAGVEEFAAGLSGACDEAEDDGFVAGDFPIGSGLDGGACDVVSVALGFGGFAEEVAGFEDADVGVCEVWAFDGPFGIDVGDGGIDGSTIDPVYEAECEEVFAAEAIAMGEGAFLERLDGEAGDVEGDDLVVAAEFGIVERVGGEVRHFEVVVGEGGGVDDEESAFCEVREVDGEGGGVHGDEGIGFIAWCEDAFAAEVDLEGGDAGDGSDRGADFRGEVREGCDGIGHHDAGVREPFSDDLHAVAGITGKTDDD